MNIINLTVKSIAVFFRLLASGSLHLQRTHLEKIYKIRRGKYKVFRETTSDRRIKENAVILIVGFRLKMIQSNPMLHWVFQRICILTTPFWSGFRGFRVKLWLVDESTKNYLGIYSWEGKENAMIYIKTLEKILKPISTKNSVWCELVADETFENYLRRYTTLT